MNKYKTKKEVTAHVAGMVVTEPDSGGGGITPWFVGYFKHAGDHVVKWQMPNSFKEDYLYKGKYLPYTDGGGVVAHDVVIYADPSMPNHLYDVTAIPKEGEGAFVGDMYYLKENRISSIGMPDDEYLNFSGSVEYEMVLSQSYRQQHTWHYGMIFWPDISDLVDNGDGYMDALGGSVSNIQKTSISELESEGISIESILIMQCPVYVEKWIA